MGMNIFEPNVEITQPLVPLDDLKGKGGYGRNLILPSDIFPTLSSLTAQGDSNPKLLRCDDNGYLYTHEKGTSSSGGAASATVNSQNALNMVPNFTDTKMFGIPDSVVKLIAISWYAILVDTTAAPPPIYWFQFYVNNSDTGAFVMLATAAVSGNGGTLQGAGLCSGSLSFNPMLDIGASIGLGVNTQFWVKTDGPNKVNIGFTAIWSIV